MSAPSSTTRSGTAADRNAQRAPTGHSARSYWHALRRAAVAAAGVHALFSAIFFSLNAPLLGWANLGSVLVYGGIYHLLRQHRNRLAVQLLWGEVLMHAVAATVVVGWDSGFHYYVLLMMPMVFVSPGRSLSFKLLLGVALTAFYITLDAFARHVAPISTITPAVLDALRYFNVLSTLALLAYLAHFYFGTVLRAERQLSTLAATDALTGLANRRRVMQVAEQQLRRRRDDGSPLCFVLGDVDHFKSINDRHGHETGDRVLAAVANAMRAATREADTVSRWGGEEFLIVLPETDAAGALLVAERVRDAMRQLSIRHGGAALSVTMTFGISAMRDGETLDQAIARADAAMYRGKAEGRNRCMAEAAPSVRPQTALEVCAEPV